MRCSSQAPKILLTISAAINSGYKLGLKSKLGLKMWYLDVLRVVVSSDTPLVLRDRLLVPFLTPLVYMLQGFSPENVIITCTVTFAIVLFTTAKFCLSSNAAKRLFRLFALSLYVFAFYCNLYLSPSPFLSTRYARLPINSRSDYPILPGITQLLTHK